MKQISVLSVFIFIFGCANDSTRDTPMDSQAVWDSIQSALNNSSNGKMDSVAPPADSIARIDSVAAEPVYDSYFAVWFTTSYCGGAKPTEEILTDNAKERPLYTSQIKLKNHFTGKEYILKTSPDAEATAKMEQGKYDVYLTKDINMALGTGFDGKCNLWMEKSLLTVKVDSSGKMNKIVIHFECNPCDVNMKRRP